MKFRKGDELLIRGSGARGIVLDDEPSWRGRIWVEYCGPDGLPRKDWFYLWSLSPISPLTLLAEAAE